MFWLAERDPRVVRVGALEARGDDRDALDVLRIGVRALVLCDGSDGERLLLCSGGRSIRLDACSGSLLGGPVRFRYLIEGLAGLDHKLTTLRRLVALRRLGRLPSGLFPADSRAERWILVLRVLDALAGGSSHRYIAAGLFGEARVNNEWRARSDSLRLRIQRLARTGSNLVGGGYLTLLNGP